VVLHLLARFTLVQIWHFNLPYRLRL